VIPLPPNIDDMPRMKRWLVNLSAACGATMDGGRKLTSLDALVLLNPGDPRFEPTLNAIADALPAKVLDDFHSLQPRDARKREVQTESAENYIRDLFPPEWEET
jgi:hypothetical protein